MTHGGRRKGAGRPPSPTPTNERVTAWMTGPEYAELLAGAERLELTLSRVLVEGGLALVRGKR